MSDKSYHGICGRTKVQSALFLNIVVGKSTAILKLLASEDETLLVGRDTFLVLDLGLDVVNGVRRLDLEGDSLAGQSLHKDLHTSAKTEYYTNDG